MQVMRIKATEEMSNQRTITISQVPLTREDKNSTIQQFKNNKAADKDGIGTEIIRMADFIDG